MNCFLIEEILKAKPIIQHCHNIQIRILFLPLNRHHQNQRWMQEAVAG